MWPTSIKINNKVTAPVVQCPGTNCKSEVQTQSTSILLGLKIFLFLEYLVYLRVSTVPVMTTLVTLEVQSPGGNDSVSLVHARYCNYSLNFSQGGPVPLSDLASQTESTKKPVPKIPAPDMTTLVTLEVHSPPFHYNFKNKPANTRNRNWGWI